MISREETQKKLDLLSAGALQHTPEQSYTVADRLEERAAETPRKSFLIWEGQPISYAEANRRANQYAHFALSQGLHQGDVVALMMENRPEFIYCWFGLAKIGCTTALINTHIRGDALSHALATTASKALFIHVGCLENLLASEIPATLPVFVDGDPDELKETSGGGFLSVGPVLQQSRDSNSARDLRASITGSAAFCLVFTSGTTGLPKAAKVTHARWLGTGEGWCQLFSMTDQDVFYCVLPLYHVAAGMSLLSQVLASGGSMVLRKRFSASRFWHDVRSHGVTVTQYSGEMCRYLYHQPPSADDREHNLRLISGAGLSAAIWSNFQERFGIRQIAEGYGGTEINCGLINVDNKVGSCGRIPFKEKSNARLVKYHAENDEYEKDADGYLVECDANEVGEMLAMIVDVPGVSAGRFDGYTDREATERKILRNVFRQGDAWVRTGDLFYRDEEDYFYFVDRVGDTFRWKSENVSTSEVSNVLEQYPGLEVVTVYGVTVVGHEGRAGMAAIVMQPGKAFDPEPFYQLVRRHLPDYAVPVFLRLTSRTDITSTFKLRKVDLQKAGYSRMNDTDELYVLDPDNNTYSPITEVNLSRLGFPPSGQPE